MCLLALGRQASAQDAPAAKETSKASLEGTVVKEPSGEPLKKAVVELIAENQEEGGNYTATSDQDGHFKIVGIHARRPTVVFTKSIVFITHHPFGYNDEFTSAPGNQPETACR